MISIFVSFYSDIIVRTYYYHLHTSNEELMTAFQVILNLCGPSLQCIRLDLDLEKITRWLTSYERPEWTTEMILICLSAVLRPDYWSVGLIPITEGCSFAGCVRREKKKCFVHIFNKLRLVKIAAGLLLCVD